MRDFWSTAELRARGRTSRQIAAAVAEGRMLAVRSGWYARPAADPTLVAAVRVGGVATAHSAARARGLWTPPDPRPLDAVRGGRAVPPLLRVAVPRSTSRSLLKDPLDSTRTLGEGAGVVLTWTDSGVIRAARPFGIVPVLVMLRDLFRSEAPERALAVVDSALRSRHLRRTELPALAAMLPARLATVLAHADGRAESGIETIAAFLLRSAGLRVEVQVRIDGTGRVDLLVEGRVIVECDGREWHAAAEAFEEDRRRDLAAAAGRYRVVRASWFRVLFRWHEVEAAVFAALDA